MIPGKPSFLGSSKKNMKEFNAGSLDLLVDQALFFAKKGFRQVPAGAEYHPNMFVNAANSRFQSQQAPATPQQQYASLTPAQQYTQAPQPYVAPQQQYATPPPQQYQYAPPQPAPVPYYPPNTQTQPQYQPQQAPAPPAPQIQVPAPTQVQNTARVCKGCGAIVPENLKFCGACGTKYEIPTPPPAPIPSAPLFCGECGAKTTGTKFCTTCGARV